jgi:hypothetical protein
MYIEQNTRRTLCKSKCNNLLPVGTTTYTDNVGDGTYYYVVRSQNLGYLESVDSNESNSCGVVYWVRHYIGNRNRYKS